MRIPKWAKDIQPEDITNPLMAELSELLGMENMLKFVDEYGGATFYVPKLDTLLSNVRDRQIRQEYNGANAMSLAIKYDVSDRLVRRIVAQDDRGEVRGQTSLFDK